MMLLNQNCLLLYPKVAIFDDDQEMITDLIACLPNTISLTGFACYKDLEKNIKVSYEKFINGLMNCFYIISQQEICFEALQSSFNRLAKNIPYTVALVDLDLQQEYVMEGFEFGERIEKLAVKSIIYTGSLCEEIAFSMVNQGFISGYINKANDIFETLLPAIYNFNQQFYYEHFNFTHLSALKNINLSDLQDRLQKINLPDEFLLYDAMLNYLQPEKSEVML